MISIKTLHICSYYYGSKLYKKLMDNLIKNGANITVFAPCNYNSNYKGKESYLIQEKCFSKTDRLFFHYKYGKVYKQLIKKVDIGEYGLIHAHSLFSNGYVAYKLFKEYNIPYIVAVRNTDINTFFKYFVHLRKLGVEILENAYKIIFISNSYKNKILKHIPEKLKSQIQEKSIVLPNGIDEYFFINKKEPKELKKDKINLVYTGTIDKNKNLITTIKCCDKILKNKYNIKLTVIGKIIAKEYKRIINKYDFIDYKGQKNKEEIVEIYKDMDVFVMPSKHETFGLTYVEAMTQGLPVIYTKNEGFDKFFKEGKVGYSIKYDDYREMAEKIEIIINNYKQISMNCIENSLKFNWNDIALKYIEIYRAVK